MTHGSLFSGIGGFDLAAQWMGWTNVFHCEWNSFGQRVLKHYWPEAISYHDITTTDFTVHRGKIYILTGGFPCQPYSQAGKRLGKEDSRHLWPEMLRAIREIQPSYVVGENVSGLLTWNGGLVFDEVQTELESEGYEVTSFVLPAAGVNAPHRRDRVWIVAHAQSEREHGKFGDYSRTGIENGNKGNTEFNSSRTGADANSDCQRCPEKRESNQEPEQRFEQLRSVRASANTKVSGARGVRDEGSSQGTQGRNELPGVQHRVPCEARSSTDAIGTRFKAKGELAIATAQGKRNCDTSGGWEWFPTQPPICGGDDGLPSELDGITFSKWRAESVKAYGNAIVPQVAYQIFRVLESIATVGETSNGH